MPLRPLNGRFVTFAHGNGPDGSRTAAPDKAAGGDPPSRHAAHADTRGAAPRRPHALRDSIRFVVRGCRRRSAGCQERRQRLSQPLYVNIPSVSNLLPSTCSDLR